MAKDDGGPAFPTTYPETHQDAAWTQRGMALRDYFAGQALVLLSSTEMIAATRDQCRIQKSSPETGFASFAYQIADAMLAERAK